MSYKERLKDFLSRYFTWNWQGYTGSWKLVQIVDLYPKICLVLGIIVCFVSVITSILFKSMIPVYVFASMLIIMNLIPVLMIFYCEYMILVLEIWEGFEKIFPKKIC